MAAGAESKKREADAETSQTQQRRRTNQRWNFSSTNEAGPFSGHFSLVVDQCVKSSALSVVLRTPVEGAVKGLPAAGRGGGGVLSGQVGDDGALTLNVGDITMRAGSHQLKSLLADRGGYLTLQGSRPLPTTRGSGGEKKLLWHLYVVIAASTGANTWASPRETFRSFLLGTHERLGRSSPVRHLAGKEIPIEVINSFVKRAPVWRDLEARVAEADLTPEAGEDAHIPPRDIVLAYRQFLEIKTNERDWASLNISPPMIVDPMTDNRLIDEAWHLHIEMDCYEEDCRLLTGGHVIEHMPVLFDKAFPRYERTFELRNAQRDKFKMLVFNLDVANLKDMLESRGMPVTLPVHLEEERAWVNILDTPFDNMTHNMTHRFVSTDRDDDEGLFAGPPRDDDEGVFVGPPPFDEVSPHEPPTGVELRFAVGARVQCFAGGPDGWVTGEVVKQWPRLDTGVDADVFPTTFFASYIVQIDNGPLFITSLDDEEFIRAEEDETQRAAHNELRLQLKARLMAAYSKYEWRLWPDPNDAHGDDSSGSGFSDPGCC